MSARHRNRRWHVVGALAMTCASAMAHAAVSCSASASGVAFGLYDPLSGTPDTSTGTVTVTCTATGTSATVPVTVDLSTGLSGIYSPRRMFSGANTLAYNLYFSTAYSQIWGDGTAGTFRGTATLFVVPGSPATARGTVYGRTPAGQDVAAGTYADAIIMTVTY